MHVGSICFESGNFAPNGAPMNRVVIVDGQLGNIGSVYNMIRRLGIRAICSGKKEDVLEADRLILPGVGAFDQGMEALKRLDLIDALNQKVKQESCPILGICLGMQLMGKHSAEGKSKGLGWLDFHCERFDPAKAVEKIPIPHIGWNYVSVKRRHALMASDFDPQRFYFVHAFHAVTDDASIVVGESNYGYSFPCILSKSNIFAVQFHPEKSHRYGMQLLHNFISA